MCFFSLSQKVKRKHYNKNVSISSFSSKSCSEVTGETHNVTFKRFRRRFTQKRRSVPSHRPRSPRPVASAKYVDGHGGCKWWWGFDINKANMKQQKENSEEKIRQRGGLKQASLVCANCKRAAGLTSAEDNWLTRALLTKKCYTSQVLQEN